MNILKSSIKSLFKSKYAPIAYILLIVIIQSLIRLWLSSKVYMGHHLSCGDCADYLVVALNTKQALIDRPSGFSFFLSLLLKISQNHYFYLFISNLLGIFSQIFLFLILKIILKNKLWLAWGLTWLLFGNPIIWQIDALLFMTESFSLFILLLAILLILIKTTFIRLRIVLLLMSVVILAYLTITKSLFVYFSPLLFILVCVEVWTLSCKKLSKLLLTTFFLCVYVLFSYAYVHEYANQYLGQTGLQNFGGRSAWANVMPFVPCAKLSDMSVNEEIKKVILTECLDSVRIQTSARSYLWSEESLMNKMEKVIAGDDRIRGNKIWTEYVLRTVIWEPAAILKATELSIFEYVWKPLSERVNYTVPPPSHPKCATMTKEYFGLTWEDYTDGWMKNFESHRKLFESLDFLALWFSRIVNIISILVLILFWPILLIKRWRLDFLTVYWWLLCVGYLFIIALGGYYVTRYYINFNALVLIFVGYFLAKYWRQIKTNPKN